MENNSAIYKEKRSIIFKTFDGKMKVFHFYKGTTINTVLKSFLNETGKSGNDIIFLYNSKTVNLGDNTTIEDYFLHNVNPIILVQIIKWDNKNINKILEKNNFIFY